MCSTTVWLMRFLLVFVLLASKTLSQEQQQEPKNSTRTFGFFNRRDRPVRGPCYCTCGLRNEGSRIVGGGTTLVNEFPWQVRLTYMNKFYCGGTLINDRYVVTAAHCVKGFMWFLIKVTLGEHDRCTKNSTPAPESRFVARAFISNFSFLNFDNDIAILRLNERVSLLSDNIRPVCLPTSKEKVYSGAKGTVSGWGTLQEDGKSSCLLQSVEVPIMSQQECRNTSYSSRMISDNMMCAGYVDGKKDSCQGDSGGPLVFPRKDKRYELAGVVSWGNGCARAGYPGVYTRVSRYIDWIMKTAKDGCFCENN